MKVKVDPEICVGCTLCVGTCPEVFRMEGDKAVAHLGAIPEKLFDLCRRAADECPVTAIEISEE